MSTLLAGRIKLVDLAPQPGDLRAEFLAGLRSAPKRTSSKLFYDERGSRLFDQICELDEYYPTRTEAVILRANIGELTTLCGPECLLVELGSGSSTKTEFAARPSPRAGGLRADRHLAGASAWGRGTACG